MTTATATVTFKILPTIAASTTASNDKKSSAVDCS